MVDVREKLVEIVCDAMEADGCIGHCNHAPCFAVERVVNALIENGVTVQESCKACAEATQNCIVKLQEQIAELRSVQEWKPISEPPKEKGTYLVCTDNGGVLLGHWYGTAWNAGGGAKKHLAYWMEKPQPPKGE